MARTRRLWCRTEFPDRTARHRPGCRTTRSARTAADSAARHPTIRPLSPLLRGDDTCPPRRRVFGKELRREQKKDNADEMRDERQQDALAQRNRAPDRRNVWPVILEIEIHQVLTAVYQPGIRDWGLGISKES